jgi:hypothetical protein
MGLYSLNCRQFFVCRAVNWEPLGQFTSNFAQLLELIVLRSVYFLVKFRFFIQELWEGKSTNIVWMLTTGVSCALGAALYYPMSYDNLSSVSQNVLKFYQQLTGESSREEDPFHFWRCSLLPFQSYWTLYDGK